MAITSFSAGPPDRVLGGVPPGQFERRFEFRPAERRQRRRGPALLAPGVGHRPERLRGGDALELLLVRGELEIGGQAVRRKRGVGARDLEREASKCGALVVPSSAIAMRRKSWAVDIESLPAQRRRARISRLCSRRLGEDALLLGAQLGRERLAEVVGLEHGADLDLALGEAPRTGCAGSSRSPRRST